MLNKDTLSQSIRMETPIGVIEVDESPMIDVLFLVLMFSAFCIYIYAKYFKNMKNKDLV